MFHQEWTYIFDSQEWHMRYKLYRDRLPITIASLLVITVIVAFSIISVMRSRNRKKILSAYRQKEEALKIAEQASAAKGNFMSKMSHEIRTPLNAVIGYNLIARMNWQMLKMMLSDAAQK